MSSARQDVAAIVRGNRAVLRTLQEDLSGSGDQDEDIVPGNQDADLPVTNHQYSDLPDAGNVVRIIELQPGHKGDAIVCQLIEMTLTASAHHYEALSYVWGDEQETQIAIQVNDGRLEIGPNLHRALRFLRHTDQPRFLWVDAICINQSSLTEHSFQVPLMCEIYRNATSTICFLGPAISTTGRMFAMLEKLAEESKTISNGNLDDVPAIVDYLPVHGVKTKLFDEYFPDNTVVDLATRAWWHRAWTVQELMLSKNAVLMMGKYTITWENCFAAVDHGLRMQIWGHVFLGFVVNPVIVPYISMRALMNRYRLADQQNSPAVDLLRLLIHCRHRDSRDPRDKIYAVLGILRNAHPEILKSDAADAPNIEVGYEKDVSEVYRSMSQELILKTNTLDSLGVCPETELSLPSWATDWSCTDRIGSPLMQDSLERMRKTHATKHTKSNARFSSDGFRLILRGFEITTIAALSETLPVPDLDNVSGSKASLRLERQVESNIPDFESLVPEEKSSPDFDSMAATAESWLAKIGILLARYILPVKSFVIWLFGIVRLYTVLIVYLVRLCIKLLGWEAQSVDRDGRLVMSVFQTLFTWEQFAALQEPTNKSIEPEEVYWHTLCSGTYKDSDPQKTKVIFEHWYNVLNPLRSFVRRFKWFSGVFPWIGIGVYMRATWDTYGDFWPLIVASQYRRMGRLENGWLGMLPGDAKVGDGVILAKGGRVPLVVRKANMEVDGMQQTRVTFVGEAYVHGIMDGEIWDEQRCEDIEIW